MIPRLISGWPKRGRLRREADVAGHRELAAAAEGQRVDRRDRDGRGLLERAEQRVGGSRSSLPSVAGSIFVNALMSAPAENVKMFELAKTTARSFPSISPHSSVSSPITSGDSGLAGGRSSQTMPYVAARLERDGLPGLAVVRLRVGEEALARLLAEPALRHEAPQDQRRLERARPTRTRRARAPRARSRAPARRRGRTAPAGCRRPSSSRSRCPSPRPRPPRGRGRPRRSP